MRSNNGHKTLAWLRITDQSYLPATLQHADECVRNRSGALFQDDLSDFVTMLTSSDGCLASPLYYLALPANRLIG